MRTGNSDDEDLGYTPGAVWLMIEERWERPGLLAGGDAV